MIHNMDRSGYFGASDTKLIMSNNRNTKTWQNFWNIKLGKTQADQIGNVYTRAGNLYEHGILKAIDPDMTLDGQIIYEKYKLRVNYDGYKDGVIFENKTYRANKEFKVTKEYWQQCQVEMFVYKSLCSEWFLPDFQGLVLVSYPLFDDEYVDSEDKVVIDESRIEMQEIDYDKDWIKSEYLPRVKELARAMKKGKLPATGKVIGEK